MYNFIIKRSSLFYISWVFFIAILTLVPGSVLPNIQWNFISIDKTVHIFMFAVLVFLGLLATIYGTINWFGNWSKLFVIISAIGYGYVLELLQLFIPQRSYDYADLIADCVGTIVGYGLFLGMSKILPSKFRKY